MKEMHHLSQAAINDVVKSSQALFNETVSRLNAGVRQKLAETGVSSEISNDIDIVFGDLKDPFTGLETEYLQSLYFNETFNIPVSTCKLCLIIILFTLCTYRKSIPIQVGQRYYVNTAAGSKRRKTLTVDTFHYVSILDTLKTIFESESAWNHLLGGKSSIPGVYNDFADGTVAQNHPVLKTHLNSLQVIGYYDELEICNPLGSSAKKHKLGIVFSLV